MQQYVIFNVLKEYCIPKEEEEEQRSTKQQLYSLDPTVVRNHDLSHWRQIR